MLKIFRLAGTSFKTNEWNFGTLVLLAVVITNCVAEPSLVDVSTLQKAFRVNRPKRHLHFIARRGHKHHGRHKFDSTDSDHNDNGTAVGEASFGSGKPGVSYDVSTSSGGNYQGAVSGGTFGSTGGLTGSTIGTSNGGSGSLNPPVQVSSGGGASTGLETSRPWYSAGSNGYNVGNTNAGPGIPNNNGAGSFESAGYSPSIYASTEAQQTVGTGYMNNYGVSSGSSASAQGQSPQTVYENAYGIASNNRGLNNGEVTTYSYSSGFDQDQFSSTSGIRYEGSGTTGAAVDSSLSGISPASDQGRQGTYDYYELPNGRRTTRLSGGPNEPKLPQLGGNSNQQTRGDETIHQASENIDGGTFNVTVTGYDGIRHTETGSWTGKNPQINVHVNLEHENADRSRISVMQPNGESNRNERQGNDNLMNNNKALSLNTENNGRNDPNLAYNLRGTVSQENTESRTNGVPKGPNVEAGGAYTGTPEEVNWNKKTPSTDNEARKETNEGKQYSPSDATSGKRYTSERDQRDREISGTASESNQNKENSQKISSGRSPENANHNNQSKSSNNHERPEGYHNYQLHHMGHVADRGPCDKIDFNNGEEEAGSKINIGNFESKYMSEGAGQQANFNGASVPMNIQPPIINQVASSSLQPSGITGNSNFQPTNSEDANVGTSLPRPGSSRPQTNSPISGLSQTYRPPGGTITLNIQNGGQTQRPPSTQGILPIVGITDNVPGGAALPTSHHGNVGNVPNLPSFPASGQGNFQQSNFAGNVQSDGYAGISRPIPLSGGGSNAGGVGFQNTPRPPSRTQGSSNVGGGAGNSGSGPHMGGDIHLSRPPPGQGSMPGSNLGGTVGESERYPRPQLSQGNQATPGMGNSGLSGGLGNQARPIQSSLPVSGMNVNIGGSQSFPRPPNMQSNIGSGNVGGSQSIPRPPNMQGSMGPGNIGGSQSIPGPPNMQGSMGPGNIGGSQSIPRPPNMQGSMGPGNIGGSQSIPRPPNMQGNMGPGNIGGSQSIPRPPNMQGSMGPGNIGGSQSIPRPPNMQGNMGPGNIGGSQSIPRPPNMQGSMGPGNIGGSQSIPRPPNMQGNMGPGNIGNSPSIPRPPNMQGNMGPGNIGNSPSIPRPQNIQGNMGPGIIGGGQSIPRPQNMQGNMGPVNIGSSLPNADLGYLPRPPGHNTDGRIPRPHIGHTNIPGSSNSNGGQVGDTMYLPQPQVVGGNVQSDSFGYLPRPPMQGGLPGTSYGGNMDGIQNIPRPQGRPQGMSGNIQGSGNIGGNLPSTGTGNIPRPPGHHMGGEVHAPRPQHMHGSQGSSMGGEINGGAPGMQGNIQGLGLQGNSMGGSVGNVPQLPNIQVTSLPTGGNVNLPLPPGSNIQLGGTYGGVSGVPRPPGMQGHIPSPGTSGGTLLGLPSSHSHSGIPTAPGGNLNVGTLGSLPTTASGSSSFGSSAGTITALPQSTGMGFSKPSSGVGVMAGGLPRPPGIGGQSLNLPTPGNVGLSSISYSGTGGLPVQGGGINGVGVLDGGGGLNGGVGNVGGITSGSNGAGGELAGSSGVLNGGSLGSGGGLGVGSGVLGGGSLGNGGLAGDNGVLGGGLGSGGGIGVGSGVLNGGGLGNGVLNAGGLGGLGTSHGDVLSDHHMHMVQMIQGKAEAAKAVIETVGSVLNTAGQVASTIGGSGIQTGILG